MKTGVIRKQSRLQNTKEMASLFKDHLPHAETPPLGFLCIISLNIEITLYYYIQPTDKEVSVLVVQSCLTLCDPMDCSPPCSCVHEIFQERILEWVAISISSGSY